MRSRRREPPPARLLVLLLPDVLERLPERAPVEALLRIPDAVAVEPPRVSYRALARLPAGGVHSVARRQARRMKLPGTPAVAVILHPLQYPLAAALVERHPGAELWYDPPRDVSSAPGLHAVALELAERVSLPLSAPMWTRMESLGIETGRLGSERLSS